MTDPSRRLTRLLESIDRSWSAFLTSFAGLTDDQLQQSGVVGDWSVKDLMAHITTWENEALVHLPLILDGGRPPRYSDTYGGIDAFNAQNEARWRQRSLREIELDLESTHQRLIAYIKQTPEHHLASESRFRRRLKLDAISHYPIHTAQILEWRERQGFPAGSDEPAQPPLFDSGIDDQASPSGRE